MMYYECIKGRENLLIALGDSWTAGVGAYDRDLLALEQQGDIKSDAVYRDSYASFGMNSWPATLAKSINWDVINLANGGASNSESAKRFINEFNFDSTQYKKVTVVWLLSIPERIGFYSDNQLKSFLPQDDNDKFGRMYFTDVCKHPNDPYLEASFYIKAVENFCELKGFNFVFGSAFCDYTLLKNIYPSDKNIHAYIDERFMREFLSEADAPIWAKCKHPNELGYKIIADKMLYILNNHFNHVI